MVSIGKFKGGEAANIIPDRAELRGTLRAFTPEVREMARRRLEELSRGLETMFGVQCEYRFEEGVPACRNDENVVDALYAAASDVIGAENITYIGRRTGGEDFALFAERIPGAILRIGCLNPEKGITHPGHSPLFDLDERALAIGVEILTRAAVDYLS